MVKISQIGHKGKMTGAKSKTDEPMGRPGGCFVEMQMASKYDKGLN